MFRFRRDGSPRYDRSLLGPIDDVFSRAVKTYGSHPKSVAWRDEERQYRRFQIFAGLFDLAGRQSEFSVNDLGCGYGAMFDAYKDLPEFRSARYFGYDISDEMLRQARRSIRDERATFIRSHIATKEADFSLVSGTYNLNMGAKDAPWLDYVQENIIHLWGKTRLALGFNMLSIHATRREDTLYYADPEEMRAFCEENLDGTVRMVDRLEPDEMVIFVVR